MQPLHTAPSLPSHSTMPLLKRPGGAGRRRLGFKAPRAAGGGAPLPGNASAKAAVPSAAAAALASITAAAKAAPVKATPEPGAQGAPAPARKCTGFKVPTSKRSNTAGGPLAARAANGAGAPAPDAKYFTVMYTKDPYTKKKRRFADGVLSLDGKSAKLYDDSGACRAGRAAVAQAPTPPPRHRQVVG